MSWNVLQLSAYKREKGNTTKHTATEMEVKMQLVFFLLHIHVSVAVWEHVTVMKGDTLHLTCPVPHHKTYMEWKNPTEQIMFFDRNKGADGATLLRDKRYSITKLSQSEFSISISNVTFSDGGKYTCTSFGSEPVERKVEVTVLGFPRISVTKHEGKHVIKCVAEGNHHAPRISWKFDHKPEFHFSLNTYRKKHELVSVGMMSVSPWHRNIVVKCLVRHPSLLTGPLMDFVIIEVNEKSLLVSLPATAQPQGSAGVPGTMVTPSTSSTTEDLTGSSTNQRLLKTETNSPLKPFTSGQPRDITTAAPSGSSLFPVSAGTSNVNLHEETNTTNVILQTTEDVGFDNSTKTITTENTDLESRKATRGSSSLLVFLVTSLILSLLVVVIFFAIKLRRAHASWKRENEDSGPSEESSKSKSSDAEKNANRQRGKGILNTVFTQYVMEKPPVITSVINETAMTPEEKTTDHQIQTQTSTKVDIKETSL